MAGADAEAGQDGKFQWPEGVRGAVTVSFDDARVTQLDRGLPILDRYGVKATFYVLPQSLEARLEDWRAALARGHEIGGHSMTHPCSGNFAFSRHNPLEEYTLERMAEDLDAAGRRIQELLGCRLHTFAYPCGQRFVGRGRNVRSYVPLVAERYLVGRGFRDEAPTDPTFCDLAQALAIDADGLLAEDVRRWVDRTAQEGGWLFLAGHDVGASGVQTVLEESLEALCAYCADLANGIWMDTAAAIGSYIAERRGTEDG